VRAEFRAKILPIWLLLLLATSSLPACRKGSAEKASKATASRAELTQRADAARRALEELKAPLGALNVTFTSLHEQFDPLPPGLPGFGETRAKFYATAEGLGMMRAKVPWLSGRIDAAVKSGNQAELEEISQDIAHTHEEIRQVDQLALELLHQVQPFKKLAADKADELQVLCMMSCE
jgi:hypothetical protein